MFDVVTRLRHPRYTGKNRCLKCAVINAGLTLVAALAVARIDPLVGAVALAGGLALIYFRGYLVPGTPELTKRYLPGPLSDRFRTEGRESSAEGTRASGPTVESVLLEAGVLRHADGEVELDAGFRQRWRERSRWYRDRNVDPAEMLQVIGGFGLVATEDIAIEDRPTAFVATVDDVPLGQWESRGAFLADVAAAEQISERYPFWSELRFDQRTEILSGVRLFLTWCPLCEGTVTLGQRSVESCCRVVDVLAGTCENCGRRMFELVDPDELGA